MVQTELNIGSDLTPHYDEAWTEVIATTVYDEHSYPDSFTHQQTWNVGRGARTENYWQPDIPRSYDTHWVINGQKVSIQDDCGIYPTMTIYPQDGSKYHLEITGNHTASLDISVSDTPYSLHYETPDGIIWDVAFSMSQKYHMDITGVKREPVS